MQYSTSVVVELHEINSTNFVVKVFLRNETNSTDLHLYPIPIQGCELDCPFPKFVNLLSDMMVTDIKTECQVKSPPAENDTTQVTNSYVGVAILSGLSGLLLILLLGSCWVYYKRNKNISYSPIPLIEDNGEP